MAFSIALNENEKQLAKTYAKLQGISLGEAFKKALFEKIEDEYDLSIAQHRYKEYLEDDKKSKNINVLFKELDL